MWHDEANDVFAGNEKLQYLLSMDQDRNMRFDS
jgi:hypothetical protein